jgi:HlyD family secretion protein
MIDKEKTNPGKNLGKNPVGSRRKRKPWLAIGLVTLAVVGVSLFLFLRNRANTAVNYQTVSLERGNLTATIGATGHLRASQSATLTWQTSGTVESVDVKSGDLVEMGQALASLASSSLPQNITLARADLVTAQKNLDDILHSGIQRAQAQVDLVNAQKNVNSTQATLDAMQGANRGGTSADVGNARAQVVIAQQAVDQAEIFYDLVKDQPDTDPSRAQAYTNLYNARQNLERAQNNLDFFLVVPSGSDIDLARANLSLAEARLEKAQQEWDRLKGGPDPSDIQAAQARVDAAQATLNMSQLSAPFAGQVSGADPLVGDIVSPGQYAFRVDDLSHLFIDVQVSEVDINKVQIAQDVLVTFDAVPAREYHGKVVEVALAGDAVQGVVNFQVIVELSDQDANVMPGMTASVTIEVKSIADVLLVPNRVVHLVGNELVVYVLRNGELLQIPVTLGASDDTFSELLSSQAILVEGDALVLNPPENYTPGQSVHPRGIFGGG